MIGQEFGPYKIIERLGEGGLGVVYKARDRRLRRLVALKFLLQGQSPDSHGRARLLREAQAASSLNHPNIVTIHDIGQDQDTIYIVMEYVAGKPLDRALPAAGLPPGTAIEYAMQLAEAAKAAHAAGVVHRDLKPGNVIVGPGGRLKVLDFGLAKIASAPAGDSTQSSPLTAQGQVIGTVAYIAPEQAMGRVVDHRADIFSFGVMLQQLFTGRRPFEAPNTLALLHEIVYSPPAKIGDTHPHLPDSLQALILRMLEKRPEDRIQTMGEVLIALRDIRRELEGQAATYPTIELASASVSGAISTPPQSSMGTPKSVSGTEKASIAVLQFRSISPSQEGSSLADGIASEAIRALSGVPGIRVVSQLGSFRFQDEQRDPIEVARSLNIRYILTGSLRQAGNRIRVIAELTDAAAGIQLWSQSYDRGVDDLFAAQEEIANAIAAATSGQLMRIQAEHAGEAPEDTLDVAGLVRRAHRAVTHAYHREGMDEAVALLRRATELAPEFAVAHAYLGLYNIQRVVNSFSADPEQDRAAALAAVERALELAPGDPEVLENSGLVLLHCGKYERSLHVLRRTVELAQFDLVAWGYLGLALGWGGDAPEMEEAQTIFDRLIRDTPDHPSLPYWLYFKSGVSVRQGKFQEAVDCVQRSIELQPRFLIGYVAYANALGHLGRQQEALEAIGKVLAMNPNASQEAYMTELRQIARTRERMEPHVGGLIAAGIFKKDVGT